MIVVQCYHHCRIGNSPYDRVRHIKLFKQTIERDRMFRLKKKQCKIQGASSSCHSDITSMVENRPFSTVWEEVYWHCTNSLHRHCFDGTFCLTISVRVNPHHLDK